MCLLCKVLVNKYLKILILKFRFVKKKILHFLSISDHFLEIKKLYKKVVLNHKALRGGATQTLVVRPLKKHFFMFVFPFRV